MSESISRPIFKVGMVGLGMIFQETYQPFFVSAHRTGLYRPDFGIVDVQLDSVASRTGDRATKLKFSGDPIFSSMKSFSGAHALCEMLKQPIDIVCIATPDDRHFDIARQALQAGKHVIIEKPSVLKCDQLNELISLASEKQVIAKVVYHKLLDPDHKKLRTLYHDELLRHVNHGFCTLFEPKVISSSQFSEWIHGRNPATYVAVHYVKLIDFTFATNDWKLSRLYATGQRGIVADPESNTWDSVQLRLVYIYTTGREAVFDIHTSWVMPDNSPGYVDQEVQFAFDNGTWRASQRRRGVEVIIENHTPFEMKETPNHHYNAKFLEPWGERTQRGYGIEAIQRIFEEIAFVEFGGSFEERNSRLESARKLVYNDLTSEWNIVAVIQSIETILQAHSDGDPSTWVQINAASRSLTFHSATKGARLIC